MFKNKKFLGTAFIIVILFLLAVSLLTMASVSYPIAPKNKPGFYYLYKQIGWIVGGLFCFSFAALMN